jgi:acetolactate synthase-1/2/3 large subunit
MLAEFEAHKDQTGSPIKPQKAIWDARQVLDPGDILISGVGAHKMWVGRLYPCVEPNTCIIPNGFCSMGQTLPGAIAAHMVYPERKVLSIAGDGDFMMNVQEMETARRLNANLTILIWEDGGYGLISWKQDDEFDRHTALSFGNPDWLKLADAFGWTGTSVERAEDLQAALSEALDTPGPSLVVIPIDYSENALLSERLGAIEVRS